MQALEHLKAVKEKNEDYNFSLVTAYQTIAYENEYLSQYEESEKYYKKVLKFIRKRSLGDDLFERILKKYRVLQTKLATLMTSFSKSNDNLRHRRIFTDSTPKPSIRRGPKENFSFEIENPLKIQGSFKASLATRNSSKRSEFHRKGIKYLKCDSEDWNLKNKAFRGNNKRLITIRKSKKSTRRQRIVSKTPEVFPIPYKNKLNLFSTLE
jgi:hypothetical protein